MSKDKKSDKFIGGSDEGEALIKAMQQAAPPKDEAAKEQPPPEDKPVAEPESTP